MTRKTYTHKIHTTGGFTLIETMIAVGLFSVVMVVCIGALLSLADANKKTQALQSVLYNLNTSIDGMVRAIRMGSNYEVSNDGAELRFTPFGADPNNTAEKWVYRWSDGDNDGVKDQIVKEYTPPRSYTSRVVVPLTAPEVAIEKMHFYVGGESTGDTDQPRVLIIIQGKAGGDKIKTTTTFNIQASATQRLLDI